MPLRESFVLGIAGVTYLAVLASGYRLNDLLVYLPMTLYLRDPSLYPGSALVQHLLSMPYPVYRGYAAFFSEYSLFLIFLITRMALVGSVLVFGLQLVRDRWVVWIGLAAVLFAPGSFGTLGSTQLLLTEASQYALAEPFCVLALAAALARRRLLAFALGGIAFNLQPILGAVVLAMLAADLFFNQVFRERAVSPRVAVCTVLFGGLLTLPGLAMTYSGLGASLGYNTAQYLEVIRFGAYFHVFPDRFTIFEYSTTAIAVVGACLGLRTLNHRATLATWLLVIALFCAAGTIFSEWYPVPFILKMMPFRSTLFLRVIGLFGGVAFVYCAARGGTRMERAIAGLLVLATLFVLVVFQQASLPDWISGRLLLVGLVAYALSFLALTLIPARLPAVVAGVSALIFLSAVALPHARIEIPGDRPANELEATAAWARTSTQVDALFITAPDEGMAEFTVLAERNTLGNVKLAGQALFDSTFGLLLYQRLADLGCEGEWCLGRNEYQTFSEANFMQLRDRYGACYAVTSAAQHLSLTQVYANTAYRVYSLC
jgi:hypothetical protein